jgi:hypothetical protein
MDNNDYYDGGDQREDSVANEYLAARSPSERAIKEDGDQYAWQYDCSFEIWQETKHAEHGNYDLLVAT